MMEEHATKGKAKGKGKAGSPPPPPPPPKPAARQPPATDVASTCDVAGCSNRVQKWAEQKWAESQLLSGTPLGPSDVTAADGMVGLQTGGYHCYINSVAQCLSRLPSSCRTSVNGAGGKRLTAEFVALARDLAAPAGGKALSSAQDLLAELANIYPQYGTTRLQDADEFLMHLMDGLAAEAQTADVPPLGPEPEPEPQPAEPEPEPTKARQATLADLCTIIPVKVPPPPGRTLRSKRCDSCKQAEAFELGDLLARAYQTDSLERTELMAPLSEVVIIKLERESMWLSLPASMVSFPLSGLDLSLLSTASATRSEDDYELFGIVDRHGQGANVGHITAQCRRTASELSTSWVFFNDNLPPVAGDRPRENPSEKAYMLFYRKCN